jgi:hypothetical protein
VEQSLPGHSTLPLVTFGLDLLAFYLHFVLLSQIGLLCHSSSLPATFSLFANFVSLGYQLILVCKTELGLFLFFLMFWNNSNSKSMTFFGGQNKPTVQLWNSILNGVIA